MEGYGPFVGGKDLEQEGQQYIYFLLRQDGKYLIKQRVGVNTKGLMDWTANRAIKMFGAARVAASGVVTSAGWAMCNSS